MAAMPFPCNDILVVLGNLPIIFPMSSLIFASFLIPYFNLYTQAELCLEHEVILKYEGFVQFPNFFKKKSFVFIT